MATEAFTQPQFSHEDRGQSAGRMTRVCPPDPNATLSRAPEEMFVTQHVGHDTAAVSPSTRDDGETGTLTAHDGERSGVSTVSCMPPLRAESFKAAAELSAVGLPSSRCGEVCDNGAQRGANANADGRGGRRHCYENNYFGEHEQVQHNLNVNGSSGMAEPAYYLSYGSNNMRRFPETSVVPCPNNGPDYNSQNYLTYRRQHARSHKSYDACGDVAVSVPLVGESAGDIHGNRQPTNDVESSRVIPQSLLNQERELERQIKVIGKELENFKRTLDDERPKRRVIESVAKKPLARSRVHRHSGALSVNKADKYGRQHSSDVYYAVQGDRSVSRHRGDQTDKFIQCDSEVAVRSELLNPRRYLSHRCDDSSHSSSSDDEDRDLLARRSREDCVDSFDERHGSVSGRRRRHTPPDRIYRRSRHDENVRGQRIRSKANWIKPEKFNGHGSFETFLVHFENCSMYNGWNPADKAAHLRWSLTGTAAQLLWGSEALPYEELLDKLKRRFSGKGMEEKFQSELRCRRRNKGESLRELAHDIRRLMTLAYPGEQSSLSEHIARDAFLSALGDPDFELKIREREPNDLDDALRIAQRFEVFKSAVESSTVTRPRFNRFVTEVQSDAASYTEGDQGNSQQQDSVIITQDVSKRKQCGKQGKNSDFSWKDEIMGRLEKLEAAKGAVEQHAEQLTAENAALSKEVDRLRYLEQLRAVPTQQDRVQSQQPVSLPLSMQPPRTTRALGPCFKCGQMGHLQRDCYFKGRPFQQNFQRTDSHQGQAKSMSKKKGQSVAGATYIRAKVGKRVCDCLLDTGSDVTVIPASLVRKENVKDTLQTLSAANGTEIAVIGEVSVPFSIGNFKRKLSGLVSEHVGEVMLGIDWMVENAVTWEFDNSRIKIGQKYYKLKCRSNGTWCRRVVLHGNVVIPSRSEVDLPTTVVLRRLTDDVHTDGVEWGTEPQLLVPGVHVSRTIISGNRLSDIPVRAMNVRSEDVVLKAGTNVADLNPVTVLSTFPTVPESQLMDGKPREEKDEVPQFIRDLIEKVDGSVPESTVQVLTEILLKHVDVFSKSEGDLGLSNLITHCIDTGDAKPIRQPLRRYPPAHVEAISQQVDDYLKQNVIEPASSPWASNLVLVKKKDGSYRCCVDYRALNSVTRKDAYPLPRIDACLDALSSAKWFSTFDLRSAYHHVLVDPCDSDKTAFICPRGMYKFRRMPFGLCNAGATFQRLMDVVMSGLHFQVCLVYLDDIIIFSETVDQHLERLIIVLKRLLSAGLKLKPEKCALFQKSIAFLGHVVSEKGIQTDPRKIDAVKDWPVPKSVRDVRAFLGLAGYYRRFVPSFASIASPLNAMLGKGKKFAWSTEAQKSFDELKLALTSSPVLAMPNDDGEFVLDTDASDFAIGAVLSQKQGEHEKVVAYASRRLDRRESKYCVTRKELLAVVYFVRYFKQYLLGRQFKIRTDHSALIWLRRTPDPIGQQARWLEVLEEFQFSIEHRPGSRHGNADAMSRRYCKVRDCACRHGNDSDECTKDSSSIHRNFEMRAAKRSENTSEVLSQERVDDENESVDVVGGAADQHQDQLVDLNTELATGAVSESEAQKDTSLAVVFEWSADGIRKAQQADRDIRQVVQLMQENEVKPSWESVALSSHDVKVLWAQWSRLEIRDGLLKRRFESADGLSVHWQVVWPVSLRTECLRLAHSGMTGGHLGRRRSSAAVQLRVYWPSWSSDLDIFLRRCESCARYHRGVIPRHGSLRPFFAGEPWERVSVDITGPHPRSARQNQYILTCVDHFSKWAEAIALRNHTAASVARVLMVHVFSRFGAPRQLLSDQGREFESDLFAELMKWMGIDKLRTTAYQPSTNGAVERFHRTLNSMLGKVVSESQRDWDDRLPLVLAAYRASPHESTGFSPNRLFLGREVRMPLDLLLDLPREERSLCLSANEFVSQMQKQTADAYVLAREHLRVAAERRKTSYDIKARDVEFHVGEWVWYWYPRRYPSRSPKWQKNYNGPYLIVRKIEPVNVVLQRSSRSKPFVVHINKLKKCLGETPCSWLISESSSQAATVGAPDLSLNNHDGNSSLHECVEESISTRDCLTHGRRQRRPPQYLSDYYCKSVFV